MNVKIKGRWEASVRPDEARNIINPCCNIVDVHKIFYDLINCASERELLYAMNRVDPLTLFLTWE